jgi:membrane fusion protein, copper/silver efflux system
VRAEPLPTTLETTGQVTFDDRRVSSIISRVSGRVEDVRVSQWDSVRRGEPIVTVYSPDYMTAEAEYLQARATQKMSGGPSGMQGLAASMVKAAERKLELLGLSAADIRAIRNPEPSTTIRAPVAGTIVEKKVVLGSAVNPGDVLLTLGTLDDVWITADIYETDLARVHVGQELEATTTAFPNETFKGVISRVSPNIDPTTHTLQIRCEVRNPGARLKPQMLARVRITTSASEALVVPQESLVFETDNYYAFVFVTPEQVERRAVVIGSWSEQGMARVISGLRAGERVVGAESIQVNAMWHEAHGETS